MSGAPPPDVDGNAMAGPAVVSGMYDSFRARDVDASVRTLSPEVTWTWVRFAHVFTVVDELIVSFEQIVDSAPVVAALDPNPGAGRDVGQR